MAIPILAQNSGVAQNAIKSVASAANETNSEKTKNIEISRETIRDEWGDALTTIDKDVKIFYKDDKITKIEYHCDILQHRGLLAGAFYTTYRYTPSTKNSEIDRSVNAGQGQLYRYGGKKGLEASENEVAEFMGILSKASEKCDDPKIQELLKTTTYKSCWDHSKILLFGPSDKK